MTQLKLESKGRRTVVQDAAYNNRIDRKFRELSEKNERALICYLVPGYPDIKTGEKLVSILVKAGADIIEIGIPFSDPIADGPAIQEAYHHSLTKGMTPEKCLRFSQLIRKKYPELPIVLMTYSNIPLRAGFRKFMRKSKECGVDGFILPDMQIEGSEVYLKETSKLKLSTIFLASPNTNADRLKAIISKCSGFLYLVSVYGTTGSRQSFENYTATSIKNVKKIARSNIPVAVGFGISTPEHGKFMFDAGADAIIIASAIINKIKEYSKNKRKMNQEIQSFVSSMKNVTRKP
ncbi:MAG: tryptophan synthase subunit alpha [Candidatus Nitrosopolaris sp.]